jgi:molybdate transport system regulatory protein
MNELPGILRRLEQENGVLLAEVEVSGVDTGIAEFAALLLHAGPQPDWPIGGALTLTFKETEVALAKNLQGEISLRNRHRALITGLGHGRLLTAVQLQFGEHPLTAVITSGSARRLQLQVGDEVEWLVKANEMQIRLNADSVNRNGGAR